MTRLSFDEEAWRRGQTVQPLPEAVRSDIESALRARLLELVSRGEDVVLDFSFWSRAMRDEYRGLLRPHGVVAETVYLATPRGTALERVQARTGGAPNEVQLSPDVAARYYDHFQPPTADEGPLTVLGR